MITANTAAAAQYLRPPTNQDVTTSGFGPRASPPETSSEAGKEAHGAVDFWVRRREQLVSRKEIVTKLWRSNLFIDTEPNINNIVRKIRTALGDNSAKPRFMETVVGKGYRFIGPIRVIDARYSPSGFGSNAISTVDPEKAGLWRNRSSLAVLHLILLGKATDDRGVCLEHGTAAGIGLSCRAVLAERF
jgi:DNA-binding winged helix-turn-helix (wHTH) protein